MSDDWMELNKVKMLASKITKAGISRIAILDPQKAMQAITKDDVRELLKTNAIKVKRVKGVSRGRARKRHEQRKKGRRSGHGVRKGTKRARLEKKKRHMIKVRALRKTLKELKPTLKKGLYRKLYLQIKGGFFRSKKHLIETIKEMNK
ncbi:MAG: 50S ribosomal protein L19e [archaeon]